MRLRVVPSTNWKRERGWRWTCHAVELHPSGRPISGFSHEGGFTARWKNNYPSAQARAMDGARRHLIKYHRLEDQ